MFCIPRPFFEVVKEGWIFHFVSGDRRFVVNERIIQWIEPSRQAGSFAKNAHRAFS
jgi:hypothetical protein